LFWHERAGRYETTGAFVTVTRSGRTKLLDPRYDIRNHSPTGFTWGYAGSGPAQLALAILADYFGDKPGGKALADALYQPFKFAVIVALPQECDWKMSFEEVGIILCRLLTDKRLRELTEIAAEVTKTKQEPERLNLQDVIWKNKGFPIFARYGLNFTTGQKPGSDWNRRMWTRTSGGVGPVAD
jgi:uncharacterized protein DUF6166